MSNDLYERADVGTRVCGVCSGRDTARLFVARDPHYGIPGAWWIRECASCHSYFVEDPPTDNELSALYPSESYYSFRLSAPSRLRSLLRRAVGADDRPPGPRPSRPGRVLDFGSGAGSFLLDMRRRGWDGAGVEASAAARAAASRAGLDVRAAIHGPNGFEPDTFDYVRANHSLEHVTDPLQVLTALWTVCKPGGTLFVGVPTTSGLMAKLFGPYWWYLTPPLHPVVFSTVGLRELVVRAGFVDVRTRTGGDYASTAGSLQIFLNRRSSRRSSEGAVFRFKPLLVVGQWIARGLGWAGRGDRLELTARKPTPGDADAQRPNVA